MELRLNVMVCGLRFGGDGRRLCMVIGRSFFVNWLI